MFPGINSLDFDSVFEKYGAKGEDNILKPSFGKGSIADIPAAINASLGIGRDHDVPELMRGTYENVDHLVFFLMDGFGHSTIENSLRRFPMGNLSSFLEESSYVPVTSVFPSTTSTATVTVQTSRHPLRHGIIGYTSYISELGAVCNMITLTPLGNRGNSILDRGWEDHGLFSGDTLYSNIAKSGAGAHLYLPAAIRNSGLTRITGRGSEVWGYYSLPHMFTTLRRNIETAPRGSFHFCYISTVDTISHNVGPNTEEVSSDIDHIFHLLRKELIDRTEIDGSLGIMISADHGHTTLDQHMIHDAASDPKLLSYLRAPVVGDMRAPFLRVRNGMADEAFDYIEGRYGDHFITKHSGDAIREGFFGIGDAGDDPKDRFGDIILMPRGRSGMIDSRLNTLDPDMGKSSLVGVHGGLSKEEMAVPFISMVKNYR